MPIAKDFIKIYVNKSFYKIYNMKIVLKKSKTIYLRLTTKSES